MSSSSASRFTEKQGQYLAFIATYTLRRDPSGKLRSCAEERPWVSSRRSSSRFPAFDNNPSAGHSREHSRGVMNLRTRVLADVGNKHRESLEREVDRPWSSMGAIAEFLFEQFQLA